MRVLYFISTFLLDRHLGFEPTLQLKGWNSRALQNETHMRASILMNTGPLPRPMASQKALLRNPVGPHDGLVPKASNSGIFPSCPNQKAARLGSVRFGSRPLRPNLAAPLSFRLGGRVGKEGGGGVFSGLSPGGPLRRGAFTLGRGHGDVGKEQQRLICWGGGQVAAWFFVA